MLSIAAGDSDDEEDFVANLPAGLAGMKMPDDSAYAGGAGPSGAAAPRGKDESFMLSQSGTFKVQDFQIDRRGLETVEAAGSPGLSPGAAKSGPEIESIEDLEMLEELGSGASGTVWRARHRTTGAVVAVKQVQILEKARRDQAVSELRIMRKHQCPWLVSMHNAFYEEAKVAPRPRAPRDLAPRTPGRLSLCGGRAAAARPPTATAAPPLAAGVHGARVYGQGVRRGPGGQVQPPPETAA